MSHGGVCTPVPAFDGVFTAMSRDRSHTVRARRAAGLQFRVQPASRPFYSSAVDPESVDAGAALEPPAQSVTTVMEGAFFLGSSEKPRTVRM